MQSKYCRVEFEAFSKHKHLLIKRYLPYLSLVAKWKK